jgi:hypothetical protein
VHGADHLDGHRFELFAEFVGNLMLGATDDDGRFVEQPS